LVKDFKFEPKCRKDLRITSLPSWALHIRKCPVCLEATPQEVIDEINRKYRMNISKKPKQEVKKPQEKIETKEVVKEEPVPEERPETKAQKESGIDEEIAERAREELNAVVANLPVMQELRESIIQISKELANSMRKLASEVNALKSMRTQLTVATSPSNDKPKAQTITGEVSKDETPAEKPKREVGIGDKKGMQAFLDKTVDPQTLQEIDLWVQKQKEKLGMTGSMSPRSQMPSQVAEKASIVKEWAEPIRGALQEIRYIATVFKGGGQPPPPPTPEELTREIITTFLRQQMNRKDPVEYIVSGIDLAKSFFKDAVSLVRTEKTTPGATGKTEVSSSTSEEHTASE